MMKEKALLIEINNVLFELWDPIPVNYNENLRDEYEPYALQISRLILNGASKDKIADELKTIKEKSMGFEYNKAPSEEDFKTAEALLKIKF